MPRLQTLTRPAEPSEDEAAADAARHHLDAYSSFVFGIRPELHHQEWCQRIQDVVEDRPLWLDGTTKSRKRKLLLTAPPGSAKSTYFSQVLPTWYLGKHPEQHVLFYTSIGPNAANFDGVVELALLDNPRHRLTFPDERCRPNLKRGWSSEGRFLKGTPAIDKDPAYRAVGWGTSILGGRCDGYVMDDVLNQEQSESETEQAHAKTRFEGTVDTRLHPNGWALGVMTRWHELDLPSYLRKLPDWEHVNYPALVGGDTAHPLYPWNTAGANGGFGALWQSKFSAAWLLLKRLANPELYEAYWQGDPTTLGGSVFKGAHFQPLPDDFAKRVKGQPSLLSRLVKVQMWDLNYSEKQTADWTVGLTLGIDIELGKLYVLRIFRAHLNEHQHAEAITKEIMLAKPAMAGIWRGAYRLPAVQDLVRRVTKALQGRHACTILDIEETKDKVIRARLPASYGAAGDLYAYKEASWWPVFLAECLGFPKRAHDDQVDALSGAVQLAIEYGSLAALPATSDYGMGFASAPPRAGSARAA